MYKIHSFIIKNNLNDNKFTYQKKNNNFDFCQNKQIIKQLNDISFNNYLYFIIINLLFFVVLFLVFILFEKTFFLFLFFMIFLGINFYKIIRILFSHVFLEYKLPEKHYFISNINEKLVDLSFSGKIFRIEKRVINNNLNRFSGNKVLYQRRTVFLKSKYPPHLHSNLKIYSLGFDDISLSFFPDMLLLLFNNHYISVPYSLLKINYSEKKYHEFEEMPADAEVIGKTWLHPRRNGKPDKRYKKNIKIPVILYAELLFIIADFLKIEIQVSDLKAAYNFATVMQGYCQKVIIEKYVKKKEKRKKFTRNVPLNDEKNQELVCFQILGITPSASREEIKSAYRKLIKKYHPDLFFSKGLNYAKNAEEMMKKINLAYEKINRP